MDDTVSSWYSTEQQFPPQLRPSQQKVPQNLHPEVERCGVFVPQTTRSVQMSSKFDVEKFLVGDAREVKAPVESNMARRAVLNALRTIVPSRGVFRVAEYTVDLVIYDFYYAGAELRMIIVTLDTLEIFDAFAFQEDWMHMLRSCSDIIEQKTPVKWSDWSKSPGFSYFYIKCQQLNKFQSLDKAICSAAKSVTFNKSLFNWITGLTRCFLSVCEIKNVPQSWKPFDYSMAPHLYASAQLTSLSDQHKCSTKENTNMPCTCNLARDAYCAEQKPGKIKVLWHARRLLHFMPTATNWRLRNHMKNCVNNLRELKLVHEKTKGTSSSPPPPPPKIKTPSVTLFSPSPAIKVFHKSTNTQQTHKKNWKRKSLVKKEQRKKGTKQEQGQDIRCLFRTSCDRPVTCYWVKCCSAKVPVMCEYHASRLFRRSDALGMSKCPKHAITGLSARIIC